MALVDVLIPVYNAVATVEAAIDSIRAQTVEDLRIIAIDDGSTDGTDAVLARLAAAEPRLTVITQANRGIVDALNAGLAASTAAFVARHDADDLAFADRLAVQLDYLRAHAECVAVGCNAHHIDAAGRRTGYVTQFAPTVSGDPYAVPSQEPYLLHPFLLVRRQALVEVAGYRHAFHSEDTDLYWRLAARGKLVNLPEALGEYRIHAASVSSRSIVNGRIAAVDSQRASVSEQRRREGRADLTFSHDTLAAYRSEGSLRHILDVASQGMSAAEKAYLEVASAAKLLELSSYRPYTMTREDCATIRRAIAAHYGRTRPFDRRQLVFRIVLDRRRVRRSLREVLRLVPWTVMPRAVAELAWFVGRKRILGAAPSGVSA